MIEIEIFPNPNPNRDYLIQHVSEEFTSVCPKTGHPDFARVVLSFVPNEVCVELKAYKLYLQSFRNQGIFFEAATNKIFTDIWALLNPKWMRLETIWSGRGGIHSNVIVEDAVPAYNGPKTPLYPQS